MALWKGLPASARSVGNLLKKQSRTRQTRDLQSEFDRIFRDLKKAVGFTEAKRILSRLQHSYSHHFRKASNIDELFLSISVPISWFHYDLLYYLLDHLKQGDFCDSREEFAQYSKKLKLYFEERVKPLEDSSILPFDIVSLEPPVKKDNNHTLQVLVMDVDSAWDQRVLIGDSCNKTCDRIVSILGKSGNVSGHYHEPMLFIVISQPED